MGCGVLRRHSGRTLDEYGVEEYITTSWGVWTVGGRGRTLFIVESLVIIVPTPFINVLFGECCCGQPE
jgi:hypothetical protein